MADKLQKSFWAKTWSQAINEEDFGVIIDWFVSYFFSAGIVVLLLSGAAAGIDTGMGKGFGFGVGAWLRVSVLSLLFAAASAVSGWLLGLLFGIPRTLARPQPTVQTTPGSGSTPSAASGDAVSARSPTSRTNTNLEDISDWLTKTIVGVGLTQLYSFPHFMWQKAGQLNSGGFGWDPYGQLLALALFLYFAPGGFWLGYVGTRTFLTGLFDKFDSLKAAVNEASNPQNVRLDISGRGIAPVENRVAEADRVLLRVPLQALSTAREISAWGAAQARAGNLAAARTAFEEALRTEPNNQDFKQQLATVYTVLGLRDDAARLTEQLPNTDVAVLNALYEPPPGGFQKAIEIGEQLLRQPGQEKNANLHVWLAAAYGQQHAYEKARGATEESINATKIKALREIEAAIVADSRTKGLLHSLWKPESNAEDRDLESFGPNDPDLIRLLES